MVKLKTRKILPGVCSNEVLGRCSEAAEIVFERLAMAADREGRLEDRPTRIRILLRPYRKDMDMDAILQELADADSEDPLIIRYEVGGVKCICLPKFKKHQWVFNTEKPSLLPPPPGWVDESAKIEAEPEPPEAQGSVSDPIPYAEIIADLNEVTGQHFKASTQPFRDKIRARWNESADHRLDAFKHVHRVKYQDYLDGHFAPKEAPHKKTWLTPETLYRPGNFAKYLQQELVSDRRPSDVPV